MQALERNEVRLFPTFLIFCLFCETGFRLFSGWQLVGSHLPFPFCPRIEMETSRGHLITLPPPLPHFVVDTSRARTRNQGPGSVFRLTTFRSFSAFFFRRKLPQARSSLMFELVKNRDRPHHYTPFPSSSHGCLSICVYCMGDQREGKDKKVFSFQPLFFSPRFLSPPAF